LHPAMNIVDSCHSYIMAKTGHRAGIYSKN
jgi:hypothetical protein